MGTIISMCLLIWGGSCFLGVVFWWDSYSQYPEFFPFAKHHRWQIDTYELTYETYGDKAVKKRVLFNSLFILAVGMLGFVLASKDSAERRRIEDYQHVVLGECASFAGGELTVEETVMPKSFTAIRYNVDKNRYEEVEVEADMYRESLLVIKTTLTNNSSDMLSITQEDLKFYAKPVAEGNNINGHVVVDGYLYQDAPIELAVGESVPVWFWMSLTMEEQEQLWMFVLQHGRTGCVMRFFPIDIKKAIWYQRGV